MNIPSNTPTESSLTDSQKEKIRANIDKTLLSEIQRGSHNFESEFCIIDLFDCINIGSIENSNGQEIVTYNNDIFLSIEDIQYCKTQIITWLQKIIGVENIISPLFMRNPDAWDHDTWYYCWFAFTVQWLKLNKEKYGNILPIEIDPGLQVAQTIYAILDTATQKNHTYVQNIAKKPAKERTENDHILLRCFNRQFIHILTNKSDDK